MSIFDPDDVGRFDDEENFGHTEDCGCPECQPSLCVSCDAPAKVGDVRCEACREESAERAAEEAAREARETVELANRVALAERLCGASKLDAQFAALDVLIARTIR